MSEKLSTKLKNWGQTFTVFGVIAAVSVLLLLALYSRDYNLKVDSRGIYWAPEIGIQTPSTLTLNNDQKGKVVCTCNYITDVEGYQFRIAGTPVVWMGKTYRTATNGYIAAGFHEGQKVRVQVRAYKTNSQGRVVYGRWSGVRATTVR